MKEKRAFSIIELLLVIGIMGLMAGLMLPAIGLVQEKAARSLSSQKLSQLGLVINELEITGQIGDLNRSRTIMDWIEVLARDGKVNERGYFLFPEDGILSRFQNEILEHPVVDSEGRLIWDNSGKVSLTAIVPLPNSRIQSKRIPIVWSRGLTADGTWNREDSPNPGVYGNGGGFILFQNGRVQFFKDLRANGGQLRNIRTGLSTSNIMEAIPQQARILNGLSLKNN